MNEILYKQKALACWRGKAIGGTLGMPYEGWAHTLDLSFYDPIPTDLAPNDDLDLQVVWAMALNDMEDPIVDRQTLADAWLRHNTFPCDEYAVATRNLRNGIRPPYSGSYDNWFVDGLGAAIRSEIWACLAPGDPALAARYAYEDACIDHDGDGIMAEIFLAALESAAFVESDLDKLLDIGLEYISPDCRLRNAIEDTRKWCAEKNDFKSIRALIMKHYGNDDFTDVIMNIPFIVAGLLLGNGDFGKSLCMVVNFGMDTDCTGATAGAILGLINPKNISKKWLDPIGNTLLLSKEIVGVTHPGTIEEFSELVCKLRNKVKLRPENTIDPIPDFTKTINAMELSFLSPKQAYRLSTGEDIACEWDKIVFPGTVCEYSVNKLETYKYLAVRRKFYIETAATVRVMFNTDANCDVMIDGKLHFSRECGKIVPSFHRVPKNQSCDLFLEAGEHEISATLLPYPLQEKISWVMGIGELPSYQWLKDAF